MCWHFIKPKIIIIIHNTAYIGQSQTHLLVKIIIFVSAIQIPLS